MAVRAAIGAGRARLVRLLMTESLLLAFAGGTLGLLLAQWGVDLFSAAVGTPQGADWIDLTVDRHVVLFALAAALVTALLFGLGPASSDAGGPARRSAGRQENVRRGTELAPASRFPCRRTGGDVDCPRVGCGGDCRKLGGVRACRCRVDRKGCTGPEGCADRTAPTRKRSSAWRSSMARSSGCECAERRRGHGREPSPAEDRDVPHAAFVVDGSDVIGKDAPFASVRFVDAGYLTAMAIRVTRGRAFTVGEARSPSFRAVMINETMARRYWRDRDPIDTQDPTDGRHRCGRRYTRRRLVGDVAQRQLPAAPENQVYLPLAPVRELTLMVRVAADRHAGRAAPRGGAIDRSVDPGHDAHDGCRLQWYTRDRRLQGVIIGVLGVIAMLLAALGVYGTMALLVTERSREIAIRMALGSSNQAILRLVLGRGLGLTSVGVCAGVLLACALGVFIVDLPRLRGSTRVSSVVPPLSSPPWRSRPRGGLASRNARRSDGDAESLRSISPERYSRPFSVGSDSLFDREIRRYEERSCSSSPCSRPDSGTRPRLLADSPRGSEPGRTQRRAGGCHC